MSAEEEAAAAVNTEEPKQNEEEEEEKKGMGAAAGQVRHEKDTESKISTRGAGFAFFCLFT